MENDKARLGHSAAVPVISGLICLYFLCPYIYLAPFILIYGRHGSPPAAVLVCFQPIKYLVDHVPIYRRFLESEGHLLGID